MPNLNNAEDGFGKQVAELAAILGTLNEQARERINARVKYHTDKTIMAMGFPETGWQLLQVVVTIAEVVVADLISEGYLAVTDEGFAVLDPEDVQPPLPYPQGPDEMPTEPNW